MSADEGAVIGEGGVTLRGEMRPSGLGSFSGGGGEI